MFSGKWNEEEEEEEKGVKRKENTSEYALVPFALLLLLLRMDSSHTNSIHNSLNGSFKTRPKVHESKSTCN